ncbi:MAG: hypothetical protein IJA07_09275 [Agathobacter sp.]|nr:hypothetical protein [Agathobacter sp.]
MVYDANSIDIIGERNDGGIELYIISSGAFDDSAEQQTLLLDKIENYLTYMNSNQFQAEFPMASKENKWIVLRLDKQPSSLLLSLCEKINVWVKENGVNFSVCLSNTNNEV